MNENDIQQQVRKIIARVGRLDEGFSAKADVFRELGVESMAALDLLLQIEEEWGISIADEEFRYARTLEQMALLVVRVRGKAA